MNKYLKIILPLAILGNVLYALWILYNGIDSGFTGSPVAVASYIGLIFLLIVNSILLSLKDK